MKFIMRLTQEFEADNEEAAQDFVMSQVKDGLQAQCIVEIALIPTPEEKEAEQAISFHDLLNNLNSSDMTKN